MKKILMALVVISLAAAFSSALADEPKQCSKDGTCKISSKEPTEQAVVIDPVCGMDIEVTDSKYQSKFNGKTYHFCSAKCKKEFDKNPSKYIGKENKKK